jgi:hypothetical protein
MTMKTEGTTPSAAMEKMGERIIVLLLMVEGISVFLLWTINSLSATGQNVFAVYLTVNFIAFAMMSYIYRVLSSNGELSRFLIAAGCAVIAILLLVSYTVPS